MSTRLGRLLPLLALAAPAAAAEPGPTCAAVQAKITAPACRATAHGVVVAVDAAEADRLAALGAAGEARFLRYFGAPTPTWALVQGGTAADRAALKAIGVKRTLPWPTTAQFAEAASASVARGAEAQARAQGVPADRIVTVVEGAKAQWLARNPVERRRESEGGAVPHELGHLWLIERYWPGASVDTGGHYGGPGPDWLDETAAVLMEDDAMTAGRRTQFWRGVADDPQLASTVGVTSAALLDLEHFFAEDHPLQKQQDVIRPATAKLGMTVLTGEEARKLARGAVVFYLQSRMFADWALAVSGDPHLFGDIAAALGTGQTFDAWLAGNGKRNRLGATTAETAQLWRAWVASNRPKGGTANP